MPSAYTLSLFSLDGLEDTHLDAVEINTTLINHNDQLITLDIIPGLPPRRLWNCTIKAYGCQIHSVLNDIELSEFAIIATYIVHVYSYIL